LPEGVTFLFARVRSELGIDMKRTQLSLVVVILLIGLIPVPSRAGGWPHLSHHSRGGATHHMSKKNHNFTPKQKRPKVPKSHTNSNSQNTQDQR
jgi:hypothetical protein